MQATDESGIERQKTNKNYHLKGLYLPVSKLNKTTALAHWDLHMNQLTKLTEHLSQRIVGNIGVQTTNKYLQSKGQQLFMYRTKR